MKIFHLCMCGLFLFGIGNPVFAKEPSYRRVLSQWTAQDTDYARSDSIANLAATATYLSDAWFNARVNTYAKEHDLNPDEKARYAETLSTRLREEPTLFLAFYTRDKLWNTLDGNTKKNKTDDAKQTNQNKFLEPLWRLRLDNEGNTCEPKTISKVKTVSPEERYFFPYLKRWDHAYLVTFPKTCVTDERREIALRIDGVYGHVLLNWREKR